MGVGGGPWTGHSNDSLGFSAVRKPGMGPLNPVFVSMCFKIIPGLFDKLTPLKQQQHLIVLS